MEESGQRIYLKNWISQGVEVRSLTQVLDLVDAEVTLGNGDEAVTYQSPFAGDPVSMAVYMADLMDSVTTQDSAVMPGRINLNECPAELLYGIPLLSEDAVQLILDQRDPLSDDPVRHFETWLLVEGILSVEEMRSLTPLLCGGGDVFPSTNHGVQRNQWNRDTYRSYFGCHFGEPEIGLMARPQPSGTRFRFVRVGKPFLAHTPISNFSNS